MSKLECVIHNIKEVVSAEAETDNQTRKIDAMAQIGKDVDRLERAIRNIKEAIGSDANYLAKKIESIRHTYVENWEREGRPVVTQFVKKVGYGLPVPVLTVCGKGTQEIRFTKYLAHFLDSNANHGLEYHFLKALFDQEAKMSGLGDNWYHGCTTKCEVYIGSFSDREKSVGCICDIVIFNTEFAILVEQKILSSESDHTESSLGQLHRYDRALQQNIVFENKKLMTIYLTPDGKAPSAKGWTALSHKDLISRGMMLLKSSCLSRVARENLIRLLIELAIGPYQIYEQVLEDLIFVAKRIDKKGFNLKNILRFNRLVSENELLFELIKEV